MKGVFSGRFFLTHTEHTPRIVHHLQPEHNHLLRKKKKKSFLGVSGPTGSENGSPFQHPVCTGRLRAVFKQACLFVVFLPNLIGDLESETVNQETTWLTPVWQERNQASTLFSWQHNASPFLHEQARLRQPPWGFEDFTRRPYLLITLV